jgi:hypothetical protein
MWQGFDKNGKTITGTRDLYGKEILKPMFQSVLDSDGKPTDQSEPVMENTFDGYGNVTGEVQKMYSTRMFFAGSIALRWNNPELRVILEENGIREISTSVRTKSFKREAVRIRKIVSDIRSKIKFADFEYNGVMFDGGLESFHNLMQYRDRGRAGKKLPHTPDGLTPIPYFRAKDNQMYHLEVADLEAIDDLLTAQGEQAYTWSWQKKTLIDTIIAEHEAGIITEEEAMNRLGIIRQDIYNELNLD